MSMMARNRVRRGRKRADSVVTVEAEGEGLLCFAADGASFDGQLEASDERDFDLCGRLLAPDATPPPPTPPPIGSDGDDEHTVLLEQAGDDESPDSVCDSGQASPADRSLAGRPLRRHHMAASVPASLISPQLFEEAMRALTDAPPGAQVAYDVHIRDREEGSEHRVRFVPGWSGATCQLDSKEVRFTAEKRYRGQRADMIIQRRLGPALVGRGCVVFTGHMRIEYQYDYLDRPKWCL